jgi:hypothetical protein
MEKIVNRKWMIGVIVLVVSAMLLLSATPAMSAQESSTGAQVVVPEYIDVGLNLSLIDFGSVNPGTTGSNAIVGSGWPVLINITENTNVVTNISIKASGDAPTSDYCTAACAQSFTVNGHSYSNTSAFTASGRLNADGTYNVEPFTDWGSINPPGAGANATRYIYNKIDIQTGQIAGTYTLSNDNGAISVKVQKDV